MTKEGEHGIDQVFSNSSLQIFDKLDGSYAVYNTPITPETIITKLNPTFSSQNQINSTVKQYLTAQNELITDNIDKIMQNLDSNNITSKKIYSFSDFVLQKCRSVIQNDEILLKNNQCKLEQSDYQKIAQNYIETHDKNYFAHQIISELQDSGIFRKHKILNFSLNRLQSDSSNRKFSVPLTIISYESLRAELNKLAKDLNIELNIDDRNGMPFYFASVGAYKDAVLQKAPFTPSLEHRPIHTRAEREWRAFVDPNASSKDVLEQIDIFLKGDVKECGDWLDKKVFKKSDKEDRITSYLTGSLFRLRFSRIRNMIHLVMKEMIDLYGDDHQYAYTDAYQQAMSSYNQTIVNNFSIDDEALLIKLLEAEHTLNGAKFRFIHNLEEISKHSNLTIWKDQIEAIRWARPTLSQPLNLPDTAAFQLLSDTINAKADFLAKVISAQAISRQFGEFDVLNEVDEISQIFEICEKSVNSVIESFSIRELFRPYVEWAFWKSALDGINITMRFDPHSAPFLSNSDEFVCGLFNSPILERFDFEDSKTQLINIIQIYELRDIVFKTSKLSEIYSRQKENIKTKLAEQLDFTKLIDPEKLDNAIQKQIMYNTQLEVLVKYNSFRMDAEFYMKRFSGMSFSVDQAIVAQFFKCASDFEKFLAVPYLGFDSDLKIVALKAELMRVTLLKRSALSFNPHPHIFLNTDKFNTSPFYVSPPASCVYLENNIPEISEMLQQHISFLRLLMEVRFHSTLSQPFEVTIRNHLSGRITFSEDLFASLKEQCSNQFEENTRLLQSKLGAAILSLFLKDPTEEIQKIWDILYLNQGDNYYPAYCTKYIDCDMEMSEKIDAEMSNVDRLAFDTLKDYNMENCKEFYDEFITVAHLKSAYSFLLSGDTNFDIYKTIHSVKKGNLDKAIKEISVHMKPTLKDINVVKILVSQLIDLTPNHSSEIFKATTARRPTFYDRTIRNKSVPYVAQPKDNEHQFSGELAYQRSVIDSQIEAIKNVINPAVLEEAHFNISDVISKAGKLSRILYSLPMSAEKVSQTWLSYLDNFFWPFQEKRDDFILLDRFEKMAHEAFDFKVAFLSVEPMKSKFFEINRINWSMKRNRQKEKEFERQVQKETKAELRVLLDDLDQQCVSVRAQYPANAERIISKASKIVNADRGNNNSISFMELFKNDAQKKIEATKKEIEALKKEALKERIARTLIPIGVQRIYAGKIRSVQLDIAANDKALWSGKQSWAQDEKLLNQEVEYCTKKLSENEIGLKDLQAELERTKVENEQIRVSKELLISQIAQLESKLHAFEIEANMDPTNLLAQLTKAQAELDAIYDETDAVEQEFEYTVRAPMEEVDRLRKSIRNKIAARPPAPPIVPDKSKDLREAIQQREALKRANEQLREEIRRAEMKCEALPPQLKIEMTFATEPSLEMRRSLMKLSSPGRVIKPMISPRRKALYN